MNGSIATFFWWFWISLAMAVFCAVMLFMVTRRREAWLRYTASEEVFWTRLGYPPRKIREAARRWEESRGFVYALWFLLVCFTALTLVHGGTYLHYKNTAPARPPHSSLRAGDGFPPFALTLPE